MGIWNGLNTNSGDRRRWNDNVKKGFREMGNRDKEMD
jgi:hypothetical protein